jgi:hypothetical protein
MDPASILASLGRIALTRATFGVATAAALFGCAGTGPAIVEHPRSVSMALVSPERDPLAGALVFSAPSAPDAPPPRPRHRALMSRRIHPTPPTRAALHVAEWSLSLGADETRATVAPSIALSAALSMSAGPAPHLDHAVPGAIVVPIPRAAVEEGAWERRRR